MSRTERESEMRQPREGENAEGQPEEGGAAQKPNPTFVAFMVREVLIQCGQKVKLRPKVGKAVEATEVSSAAPGAHGERGRAKTRTYLRVHVSSSLSPASKLRPLASTPFFHSSAPRTASRDSRPRPWGSERGRDVVRRPPTTGDGLATGVGRAGATMVASAAGLARGTSVRPPRCPPALPDDGRRPAMPRPARSALHSLPHSLPPWRPSIG